MSSNGNTGWSTRCAHKRRRMPMHVNYFPNASSKKKYRVCRKIDGKTITYGYFKKLKDARAYAKNIFK